MRSFLNSIGTVEFMSLVSFLFVNILPFSSSSFSFPSPPFPSFSFFSVIPSAIRSPLFLILFYIYSPSCNSVPYSNICHIFLVLCISSSLLYFLHCCSSCCSSSSFAKAKCSNNNYIIYWLLSRYIERL